MLPSVWEKHSPFQAFVYKKHQLSFSNSAFSQANTDKASLMLLGTSPFSSAPTHTAAQAHRFLLLPGAPKTLGEHKSGLHLITDKVSLSSNQVRKAESRAAGVRLSGTESLLCAYQLSRVGFLYLSLPPLPRVYNRGNKLSGCLVELPWVNIKKAFRNVSKYTQCYILYCILYL